jgi:hypothetical protein
MAEIACGRKMSYEMRVSITLQKNNLWKRFMALQIVHVKNIKNHQQLSKVQIGVREITYGKNSNLKINKNCRKMCNNIGGTM